LPNNFLPINRGTYGFSFQELHQERIVGIYSIGWEKQTNYSYNWNGLYRNESDVIVFQYTLQGIGEITVKNKTRRLEPGDAFFIKIPSDHCYRLPEYSDEWEFVFITLSGKEAIRCYETITKDFGHTLQFELYDSPVIHIFDILEKVSSDQINDSYETASFAFTFLMKLQQYFYNTKNNKKIPEPIAKALLFMKSEYANPSLSLDEIVEASGLSKYYFTRLFNKTINITPMKYLTKIRIDNSIELLKNKDLTVEEIALKVGFINGNYFNKVFRSSTGLSAGKYRNNKLLISVDRLITD